MIILPRQAGDKQLPKGKHSKKYHYYRVLRYVTEEEWPYHWFPTFPIGTGHALNYAAVRNTPFFGAVFSTSYAKPTLVCQDRLGTNTRKR